MNSLDPRSGLHRFWRERRQNVYAAIAFVAFLSTLTACSANGDVDALLNPKLGGETTAFTDNRNAFSMSARNLNTGEKRVFEVGDSFFEQNWVTAPASTEARDGLGPTFNALSCSSCHVLDGRGRPPTDHDDPERGLLIRLSIPGTTLEGAPLGDPNYGNQLQDRAINQVEPEGRFQIDYVEIKGEYGDGEPYTLLMPTYRFIELAFGDLSADIMTSPRIAPPVIGMGLLEAIKAEDILAQSDPDDEDGDGISGRPNMVWDIERQEHVLGRFGWKANEPSVEQQSLGAFFGDIGITSVHHMAENCPSSQLACAAAVNGGEPEVPAARSDKLVFYTQTLAVPAMRNVEEPEVRKGAEMFLKAGCAACHTPSYTTGEHEIAALSGQEIFPFTDLLLHDMGEDLADGRPDFLATGSEWRTPPLWGIGLVENVNNHTRFLHDGRARNLAEAILWHGGEAEKSRDAFRDMSRDERAALIAFLKSL